MKKFIFVLFLICFLPGVSLAADVFFEGEKNTFAQNEDFLVQVFIDTEDKTANALEGTLKFPRNLLDLKEIRTGNSSVNFWIEEPHSAPSGEIVFSGITTGGFSGEKRFLFGVVFHSKASGNGAISSQGMQVLENDGLGTKISTTTSPFTFTILSSGAPGSVNNLTVSDSNPPEDFTPFVGNDPEIFEGQYFLVFSTVDKGSGIDHYEVREGFWGQYVLAESPHLLRDQSLGRDLYVKATDIAGNERVAKVEAQNPSYWLELGLIFVILLVICVFSFLFYRKKKWPKFPKSTKR